MMPLADDDMPMARYLILSRALLTVAIEVVVDSKALLQVLLQQKELAT